jgi:hypothetical protein
MVKIALDHCGDVAAILSFGNDRAALFFALIGAGLRGTIEFC